jgi:hypothetical protein
VPTPPRPDLDDPAPNPTRPAAVAVAVALAGALLLVVAQVLEIVGPNAGSAVGAALVVTLACSALPSLLALAALVGRAPAVAGALLAGAGAAALGLVVLDLALWTDSIDANRLDLFRPLTAAQLDAGPGAVAVLVGHLLAVVAGVIGLMSVARAAQADGYGLGEDPEFDGAPVARRIGAVLAVGAVGAALLLCAGSLGTPWATTDPLLVVHSLLGSNAPTAIGVVTVALAVLIVVAAALASVSTSVAAAAVVGAGLGALGLFGSRVAAGLLAEGLSVTAASVVSAAAALVLVVAGAAMPWAARARAASGRPARDTRAAARGRAGQARWHAAAGVTCIASGVLAAAGSLFPVLTVPGGGDRPDILFTRVTLVSGALLVVAGTALLLPAFAATVRPAVGVLWAAHFAVVTAVLQSVVVAVDVPGVGIGAGTVLLGLSALGAVATGALCWHAGSVERDLAEVPADTGPRREVLLVGVPAAVVSAVALALPLYTGPGYAPETLTEWPWGWDTWGRGVLAVTLVVTAVVVSRARPARAAVGAVGAAMSMGVYLIGWPLTNGRIADSAIGQGTWAAIMGVALFAVTAVVAVRPRRP